MKNIIIAGAARSGKTTIAKRLAKNLELSHIPSDALVSAFEQVYPEHGIQHQKLNFAAICNNLENFLVNFACKLEYERVDFILDVYHLLPEQVIRHNLQNKYWVFFFGYPTVNVDEKLVHIREHATSPDWTENILDTKMRQNIFEYVNVSLKLREDCLKLGLPFFDVSNDFESALDQAYSKIVDLLDR